MRIGETIRAVWAAMLVALAPAAAAAGGLSVSPVTVEFRPGVKARALEISNPGGAAIDVQVRLFAWRGDGTADQYSPSNDLGFSPPMFHLEGGKKQVVRLVLLRPPSDKELSYRLFVDQLPGPARDGQLQMPVRMVLPVFVGPARQAPRTAPEARLAWRAERSAARPGRIMLVAANSDSRRVKLINLAYSVGGTRRTIQAGLAGYVLAGDERGWDLPDPGAGAALTIAADTDETPLSARVVVPPD